MREIALQLARQAVTQFVSSRLFFAVFGVLVVRDLGIRSVLEEDASGYLIGLIATGYLGIKLAEWLGKSKIESGGEQ